MTGPPGRKLLTLPKRAAEFIDPMECLATSKLPDGAKWVWEIKLDGYRTIAVKSSSGLTLLSRRNKLLNREFPHIVDALGDLARRYGRGWGTGRTRRREASRIQSAAEFPRSGGPHSLLHLRSAVLQV